MPEVNIKNRYLVVKGCAGLGNRLVTVLAAIQYCIKNNRILVIDWADGQFDEKGVNAFDTCFRLQNFTRYAALDSIENWETLSHSSELFKANKHAGIYDLYVHRSSTFLKRLPLRLFPKGRLRTLRESWQPIQKGAVPLGFGSDLPNKLPFDVVYFSDFLPSIDYTALRDYIALKPEIQDKIQNFESAHQLNRARGVHVRYTDKKPLRDLAVLTDFLKADKSAEPIFLCTDSAEVETLFLQLFSNVIRYPKTLPQLSGEGLHQWALYHKKEGLKRVLYQESVVELFLLSACGRLLYQGNSTFSLVSAVFHKDKKHCADWQLLNL